MDGGSAPEPAWLCISCVCVCVRVIITDIYIYIYVSVGHGVYGALQGLKPHP